MSCRAEQKKRCSLRWRCTTIATRTTTTITTATAIITSSGLKSWHINLEVNPKVRTAPKKKNWNLKQSRNKNTNLMPRTTNNKERRSILDTENVRLKKKIDYEKL